MMPRSRIACVVTLALLCALPSRRCGAQPSVNGRRHVGVAFGGGGAKGFAHVGVIRWFEEHHIPIDLVAGTSMGGLVGGAYAAGLNAAELTKLTDDTDWNEFFGASSYRYKSVRRKQDARQYPSQLEFYLRRGFALPTALNNAQEVDNLLAGIGAIYADLRSFDSLPTPFRCVALDLRTATQVVLDSGSLPRAMRATMSMPGIFPPIEIGPYLLVDGGAMNNVPADVVRDMGAAVVIAVNVGSMEEERNINKSVFGLVNSTMGAMMAASTRRGMAAADIVINPDLEGYGTFDWRRAGEIAELGYRAAEALKAQLLPLAVDEATWRSYLELRASRRRTILPVIAALDVRGAIPEDERHMRRRLRTLVGRRLDVPTLLRELTRFGALDRYMSVSWDLAGSPAADTLVILARQRHDAPPILMTAIRIQNVTTDDFTFQLAARYLAFDVLMRGSELRVDGALGTSPHLGAELREGIGQSPFFAAATVGAIANRVNFSSGNAIVAQYEEKRAFGVFDLGIAPTRDFELRAGVGGGYYDAHPKIGDPGLPSLRGPQSQLLTRGIYDAQNNAVAPSNGLRVVGVARHLLVTPNLPDTFVTARSNDNLTQAEIGGSNFWSWRHRSQRVFVAMEAGSSFGGDPLPTDQFVLGLPLRLDAFEVGERRGNNYGVITVGYLHSVARLPEFLGGPVLVGTWLENGTAYDNGDDIPWYTQMGVGALVETLVGPAYVAFSFGGGVRRLYVGFGQLFR